jgi:hypothetical protein
MVLTFYKHKKFDTIAVNFIFSSEFYFVYLLSAFSSKALLFTNKIAFEGNIPIQLSSFCFDYIGWRTADQSQGFFPIFSLS